MKALITGANGFIGSHLSVELADLGFEVVGVARRSNSANPKYNQYVEEGKILHIQGDILTFDFNTIKNVDYVFHIAGVVSAYGKMEHFLNINLGGTKRLLNFSKQNNVKCFTYFSSAAVYGYYGYTNLPETAQKKPFNNPYSISKLKTEEEVNSFCKSNNLNFVIIRPGNVFGEYDYTSSHEIFMRVKNGKMLICANGKYKSCFVYVKNLVSATIHTTINPQFNNQDYNVTDGENETLKQYLTLVANALKVKPKFHNIPSIFAKTLACIVEGVYKLFRIKKAPLITKFSVWQNCADYNFDVSKINSTKYEKKYNLKEGVVNTVKWISDLEKKDER